MKKMGLYVDVSNLYYCLFNNLHGKLNYAELLAFIEPLGTLVLAKAYGAQVKNEADSFIAKLEKLGFETYYKEPKYYNAKHTGKADWDVGIAVSIIEDLAQLDIVVLATADGDMTPLAEYVISQGKDIIVIGSNISQELQEACTTYIEIPSSFVIPVRRR